MVGSIITSRVTSAVSNGSSAARATVAPPGKVRAPLAEATVIVELAVATMPLLVTSMVSLPISFSSRVPSSSQE